MWTDQLTPAQAADALALAERAATADGTMPLNEEAHFALRGDSAWHLLRVEGGQLVGYLHWQPGYRTAQVVVDPGSRRRGIGRGLVGELVGALRDARSSLTGSSGSGWAEGGTSDALRDARSSLTGSSGSDGGWGVWAFGDLLPAQGFAAALGLRVERGLLVMERGLATVTAPDVPRGLTLRGYTPADAEALLAVNAAAFAHHPEQGALDSAGLAARVAEPWFDPSGLILGFDADGLTGFHWTKQVAETGEVYVIGVAPRAQGRGYGKVLLHAGLAHLAGSGARQVLLYVDMAESVAVRMYERAGFHVTHRDVLYAPDRQERP